GVGGGWVSWGANVGGPRDSVGGKPGRGDVRDRLSEGCYDIVGAGEGCCGVAEEVVRGSAYRYGGMGIHRLSLWARSRSGGRRHCRDRLTARISWRPMPERQACACRSGRLEKVR